MPTKFTPSPSLPSSPQQKTFQTPTIQVCSTHASTYLIPPTKPFNTYSQLVSQLKQHGMIIEDTKRAERKLAQVGYYRLSGFSYPCREIDFDKNGHAKKCPHTKQIQRLNTFVQGTSFNQVFALYLFDKRLRQAMMDGIERVEIYLRSIIAHELGYHSPLAYKDVKYIKKKCYTTSKDRKGRQRNSWNDWQNRLQRKIEESREDCIVWHRKQHKELPFWVVIEAWDFGTMSKYFSILEGKYQNRIAARLGCSNTKEMEAWLREINTLRNRCAHHSRIWNQTTSSPLSFSSVPELTALQLDKNARSKIYGLILILWYFISHLGPNSSWILDVAKIINEKPMLPNCGLGAMGIPADAGFPLHIFPEKP